ncbi:MAG: hypothetical protein IPH85_08520 [Ignavibacteria bacterium]|nr:hypothetical protein [Ignavibacteria bacterium]MBK6419178.1 hypothetical protein [Ignavibacteria bacterium]MBK6760131.1 hypothetical protein [Ignavibacteria bacterium]MBK7185958.1 hypothetical protein [Ignavibacteria bacterium]MBK7412081.1 hypothetical protein [Ignavibacteria bacterium]
MEWFDAFEELMASIERYVDEHGQAPREVAVSADLYAWLSDIRRESHFLSGGENGDPDLLPTPHGPVRLVIDEALSSFEIVPS